MSRYLWAVGEHAAAYQPGDVIADRYRCQGSRIFLDANSAVLPSSLDEVPQPFIPYLKLSPHQPHIPQIYDWVQTDAAKFPLLLLDQAPLYVPQALTERGIVVPPSTGVQILPKLHEMWVTAMPLRQLHWLWQMANLWDAMQAEGVAASLLTWELLRVEGPTVRLLELGGSGAVALPELGEFWSELAQTARPEVQAPLQQLCQGMKRSSIRSAEAVVQHLDGSIADLGRSQQSRQIQIATFSDKGPSRQRNEDACYPISGTVTKSPPDAPLLIVCDGIGGHQGGDVASNLAIKALEQRLKTLQPDRLNAATLEVELEKAVGAANDLISQQNDNEQRFDRQRMGTTVVMGLIRAHELYITHVGDSRAYWITRWGCYQITQDDDVASREVRLGYSSYPQALQQPSSGSLVQALGMGSATNLYPTVQRFILDEDCVFLLCSDGLSDNDQVEAHWEDVILPLLDGETDLGTVSRQWVDIANHYNGYDNATVGLVHCKIMGANPASNPTVSPTTASATLPPTSPPRQNQTAIFAPNATASARSAISNTTSNTAPTPSTAAPTQRLDVPRRDKQESLFPLIAWILLLTGIAAAIVVALLSIGTDRLPEPLVGLLRSLQPGSPDSSPQPTQPDPQASSPAPTATPDVKPLVKPEYFQVTTEYIFVESKPRQRDQGVSSYRIPQGSIVKAGERQNDLTQADPTKQTWVELTVCPSGAENSQSFGVDQQNTNFLPAEVPAISQPTQPVDLKPGQTGWVPLHLYKALTENENSLKPFNPDTGNPNFDCSSSAPADKEVTTQQDPALNQPPPSDSPSPTQGIPTS